MENANVILSSQGYHVSSEDVRTIVWKEENVALILNAFVILVMLVKIVDRRCVLITAQIVEYVLRMDVSVMMVL
jgi:hypothetical protein